MSATLDDRAVYERTRTLLTRETELQAELAQVEHELRELQDTDGHGWMDAMDEQFQRLHAHVMATLSTR